MAEADDTSLSCDDEPIALMAKRHREDESDEEPIAVMVKRRRENAVDDRLNDSSNESDDDEADYGGRPWFVDQHQLPYNRHSDVEESDEEMDEPSEDDESEDDTNCDFILHSMNREDQVPICRVDLEYNHLGQTWNGFEILDKLLHNQTIEYLQISLRQDPIPNEWLSGFLYFVAHNPALKVLELYEGTDSSLAQILQAADQNPSIEKISIGDPDVTAESRVPNDWTPATTVQELSLCAMNPHDCITTLTPNHSIGTLRLRKPKVPWGGVEYESSLISLLTHLARCPGSKSIRHLEMDRWCSGLSMFLASSNSAVQRLDLYSVEFEDRSDHDSNVMDCLLWTLSRSQTTRHIQFHKCKLPAEKLVRALKGNTLPIRQLLLKECWVGWDILECDCLESLVFEEGRFNVLQAREAQMPVDSLKRCTASSLQFQTTVLATLENSLRHALTYNALTKLVLKASLRTEADLQCIIKLVEDPSCNLLDLELIDYDMHGFLCVPSRILRALEGKNVKLKRLALQTWMAGRDEVLDTVRERLPWILNLKALEIRAIRHGYTNSSDSAIADAFRKNWSLESAKVVRGDVPYPEHHEPVVSLFLRRVLESVCQRNKLKRLLDAVPLDGMSKAEFIPLLELALALPHTGEHFPKPQEFYDKHRKYQDPFENSKQAQDKDKLTLVFAILKKSPQHLLS